MSTGPELDPFSMRWLLNSLRKPAELESFIRSLPGFLGSETTTSNPPQLTPSSITLYNLLHDSDVHLGLRIAHVLKTQQHIPIVCVDALSHITCWFDAANVQCHGIASLARQRWTCSGRSTARATMQSHWLRTALQCSACGWSSRTCGGPSRRRRQGRCASRSCAGCCGG